MEAVKFFGGFWSIVFICISLIHLFHRRFLYRVYNFIKDDHHVQSTGLIMMLVGVLQVVTFTFWEWSWRGLVTVIGWVMLFVGLIRVMYPKRFYRWALKYIDPREWILSLILLFAGIFILVPIVTN